MELLGWNSFLNDTRVIHIIQFTVQSGFKHSKICQISVKKKEKHSPMVTGITHRNRKEMEIAGRKSSSAEANEPA